ncbi:PAAR domain-containing protein [Burkholderia contaminans]|uniref:PAAR domain-containing protein n=1 Tax=Burkholderia sp. D-99 TaxID=2717316 RepID=UPI001421F22F|nr:PAAR domain-containing protein [Burkholderia sp. D-99]MBZ5791277.1 PAAR domain-containing protein [Burkholderia contaminans]NHV24709.1 hypothetical protein [Burkholderia sp. D-99]
MKAVVLVGHRHMCPEHGEGVVESGSTGMVVNGRAVAGTGDRISCGAIITGGASSFESDSRQVARVGDSTSHGGVLIEGDEGFCLE